MNVLMWNTRGAAKKDFGSTLKSMVRKKSVDIVVLLETRTQSESLSSYRNSFHFTAIYASPSQNVRNNLWEDLRKLSETMNRLWLLGGDFNEIAYTHEKIGGVPANLTKCANFSSVLEDYQVTDLGCDGPLFTWKGPKWTNLRRIFKRLDRVVANLEWRMMFDDARVSSLPRILSDHNPLLIKLFENSDKKVFGDIDRRKNSITQKIANIQNDSQALLKLENDYQNMLINVLREEELFWFQKSRKKWIAYGDRNTRFYHLSTVVRRNSNKIFKLKNDGEAWISYPDDLKNMACNFFKTLFTEDICDRRWISSGNLWPELIEPEKDSLSKVPDEMEIKQITFSMEHSRHKQAYCESSETNYEESNSPAQSSFEPQRHIQDIIIIVQELIHSIRRMQGKKCFMVIKVDLEKAYDRLNWKFIHRVLD
ncbi:uncharacterized protein LOC133293538 [Gastrolobium bilobum]|uniref:uncharacterized protein LOC133293538 n=1 Tax=Gastrolobium bilobum TaxID=150636 RepID=UPI002AB2B314|nr:uncharacterized protein LOC133293538 [Gastrolobium bilobum]